MVNVLYLDNPSFSLQLLYSRVIPLIVIASALAAIAMIQYTTGGFLETCAILGQNPILVNLVIEMEQYKTLSENHLPDGRASLRVSKHWHQSPRVNGKLVLAELPCELLEVKVKSYRRSYAGSFPYDTYTRAASLDDMLGSNAVGLDWGPIDNVALAKLRGKLRHENASLGMTVSTWRQSLDMITGRLHQVRKVLQKGERNLLRIPQSKRKQRFETTSANTALEVEFGWKPLVDDVQKAFAVLGGENPSGRIIARHRAKIHKINVIGGSDPVWDPVQSEEFSGHAQVTLSTVVAVTNPNLWLLNKLGLINLPSILWDRVPWSFVANMVVNFNQKINALTDYIGLEMTENSTTRTTLITCQSNFPSTTAFRASNSVVVAKRRNRTVGTLPSVTLQAKLPSANLELCVIAGALLTQQVGRIARLIR